MSTIMKNYDGLYYVVIAKSFYRPSLISPLFSFSLPAIYYAAHFPLYPLLIKIVGTVTGYPWAMLSLSALFSMTAALVFFQFMKKFGLSKNLLWMTILFMFLPARWLVVRSVGSSEPLFITLLILSFYFFKDKKYWHAGIFGALAQLTKPPAVLLFVAYVLIIFWENHPKLRKLTWPGNSLKTILPLLIMPLSLILLFLYYRFAYGDFLAYFHSGDNIHIFWPPFQIFNHSARWVGGFWLEDIIYIYIIGALGIVYLLKQKQTDMAIYTGLFFLSTLFISHRDLSRYSLPIVPFLLIAFEPLLVKKEFKIIFGLIIIPIFLYSINFISQNTMPLADWAPFLK